MPLEQVRDCGCCVLRCGEGRPGAGVRRCWQVWRGFRRADVEGGVDAHRLGPCIGGWGPVGHGGLEGDGGVVGTFARVAVVAVFDAGDGGAGRRGGEEAVLREVGWAVA